MFVFFLFKQKTAYEMRISDWSSYVCSSDLTLNAWDSQYGLEAKPLTEVRLAPTRITPYDVQPVLREANGACSLWLGKVPIVGCACRWDPSIGKPKSDASALAALIPDEAGPRDRHHVDAVTGAVPQFAADGRHNT